MGGRVLDYEAKRIHDHGISIGEEKGETRAHNNILNELIKRGILTPEEAAQAAKYQRVQ